MSIIANVNANVNETFIYVLQKILETDFNSNRINTKTVNELEYWQNIFIKDITRETLSLYYFHFFICDFQYRNKRISKFSILKNMESNPFLNEEKREIMFSIFSKAQKIYKALSRFQHIYKYKKSPIKIDTDLYLTPISIQDKNVISICQHGYKYLFVIQDVIKIIQNSICHSDSFFPEPKPCKNPFNKTR